MRFHESVAFDMPVQTPDGSGGTDASWSEQFTARANFMYLRGGETVQASRLAGKQPVVVTIRATPTSSQIDADWRMRDTQRGHAYNIRAIVLSADRLRLELTCERGVAI